MTAADKIAEARALIGFADRMSDAALRVGLAGTSDWDQVAGAADIYGIQDTVAELADLANAQAQEIARLRQIIAQMDALTPRANKTCDQPGITLSEAIQREWPHLRVRTGETL